MGCIEGAYVLSTGNSIRPWICCLVDRHAWVDIIENGPGNEHGERWHKFDAMERHFRLMRHFSCSSANIKSPSLLLNIKFPSLPPSEFF